MFFMVLFVETRYYKPESVEKSAVLFVGKKLWSFEFFILTKKKIDKNWNYANSFLLVNNFYLDPIQNLANAS